MGTNLAQEDLVGVRDVAVGGVTDLSERWPRRRRDVDRGARLGASSEGAKRTDEDRSDDATRTEKCHGRARGGGRLGLHGDGVTRTEERDGSRRLEVRSGHCESSRAAGAATDDAKQTGEHHGDDATWTEKHDGERVDGVGLHGDGAAWTEKRDGNGGPGVGSGHCESIAACRGDG
uniref:Uncharacterized protein n=1 Tax=Arundo donax TaxID=35708 RepID=A0A0A8XN52_ARUDO